MFSLAAAGFHSFSNEPEIGIPLFSLKGSNFLYIAETNNYFIITQFIPITETESLTIIESDKVGSFKVGDRCPIPSRTDIYGILIEDINFYFDRQEALYSIKGALFQLELSAILGAQTEKNLENINSVSEEYFTNPDIAARWCSVELSARPASEVYWSSLEQNLRVDPIQEIFSSEGIDTSADVFLWLRNHANFDRDIWHQIWRAAQAQHLYREELCAISLAWLNHEFVYLTAKEAVANTNFFEVLLFVLEANLSQYDLDQIYDILEELIMEYDDVIPLLAREKGAYINLRSLFINHGEYLCADRIQHWGNIFGYNFKTK